VLNKPGSLLQILSILEEFRINIKNIQVGESKQIDGEEYTKVELVVSVSHPAKIGYLLKELKNRKRLVICEETKFVG